MSRITPETRTVMQFGSHGLLEVLEGFWVVVRCMDCGELAGWVKPTDDVKVDITCVTRPHLKRRHPTASEGHFSIAVSQ